MPYKIFISFSREDKPLAKIIADGINKAFPNKVSVFYSPESLKVGQKWKDEIRKALRQCNAVITLSSPHSVDKQWIIAEFSPFWVQEKDIYILKYGGIDESDMFTLFCDYQTCDIENEAQVGDLIASIGKKARVASIPFDLPNMLKSSMMFAIDQIVGNEFKEIRFHASQIPLERERANKVLPAAEIREIAEQIGLFNDWKTNPQLKFKGGDIEFFYGEKLKCFELEAQFRARFMVLSKAEKVSEFIPKPGDLSHKAASIEAQIIREWKALQAKHESRG